MRTILLFVLALSLGACATVETPPVPYRSVEHEHAPITIPETTHREQATKTYALAYRGAAVAVEATIAHMDEEDAQEFETLEIRAYNALEHLARVEDSEFLSALYFANIALDDLTAALRNHRHD